MPSIADEQMEKMMEKSTRVLGITAKAATKAVKNTGKIAAKGTKQSGKLAVKGICIILGKGVPFTTQNIMKALKALIYSKNGNIKFSNRNVNISSLQKNKNIQMVSEDIMKEQMKYFDKHCKEFGIKYSAVYDKKEEAYTIFYEGKNTEIIFKAIEKSLRDYLSEQKEQKQPEKEKGKEEQNEKKEEEKADREHTKQEKKERKSIMAKLAFFRHRVADREAKEREQGVEKHMQKNDLQR